MRLIFVILIFFAGTVLSKYYEKTRFDRSIHDDLEPLAVNEHAVKKQWIFTDYETHFRAYRDRNENNCYLEKLENDVTEEYSNTKFQQRNQISKTFYVFNDALTKLEAWRLAGGRIVDFCQGRKIILLQNTIPIPEQTVDPFFNILPYDENDIATRRVADVLLTPLINRAKRQIELEKREQLNKNFSQQRSRRQTQQPQGKFRGQTQSQYLNIGNDDQKEGKAEAEATQQSSHSVVSGSRGMGQAQSMSFGSIGCEDCSKYISETAPDRYTQFSSTPGSGRTSLPKPEGIGYPRDLTPGTLIKDGGRPTSVTGGAPYPGSAPGTTTTRGGAVYPGSVPGIATTGGGAVYPGNVPGTIRSDGGVVYTGSVPGTTTTGGGIIYPAHTPGTTTTTGSKVPYPPGPVSGGTMTYPEGAPATTATGGGPVYPGTIPSTTVGGGKTYPGGVPGTASGGGVYPSGTSGTTTTGGSVVYPGGVPGTTSGSGVVYPSGVTGTATPSGSVAYPGGTSGTTTGGGVTYPGGVPGTTTGGGVAYPGGVPGTTTGSGVTYPRGVPGTTTGGGVAYPGGVPGTPTGGGVTYPGGVPGTTTGGAVAYPGGISGTTTGGGVAYPGGIPGTTAVGGEVPYPGRIPGGSVAYPGGIPGTTTGGGVAYPGGVPGTTTGTGVAYPGGVPGTTTGGGVTYPGGVPRTTTGGGVAYPGGVPGTTTGTGVAYPGGVPGTTTGGSVTYPGGVPGTTTGGGVAYPGGIPGTTTVGGEVLYPGGGVAYPGSIPGTTTGGGVAYPGGVPGTTVGGGGVYPGTLPGITSTGSVVYPGGSAVPDTKDAIRGQVGQIESKAVADAKIYQNGLISGTKLPGEGIYPAVGDGIRYSGGPTVAGYPGSVSFPPGQLKENVQYPDKMVPQSQTLTTVPKGDGTYTGGTIPTSVGTGNLYPDTLPGTTRPSSGYPQQEQYSGYSQQGQYPGYPQQGQYPGYPQQGQYPGTVTWQNGGKPTIQQYPSERQNIRQQYPTNAGEISQYYQQPSGVPSTEDDNSDSQASSNVKQTDAGTQASASAQGKFGQGTAQSQVTGTYSGSGSFSAQAGSSDINKSVQTEINGGKEGATSNAQGTGGYGKSQAQVQLDSESGATSTGAQSSGWNHGTNSQVQASSKGGMADAQANGEGSTSSQAQIGFQPYLQTDEKVEKHSRPFRGGGAASAQSGTHRGQSQSQLEGSFQYGITYTGAAQAGSGSGAAASRKPFNFNLTDTELFKPFKPSYVPQILKNNNNETTNPSDIDYEYKGDKLQQGLQTSSSSQKAVFVKPINENSKNDKPSQSVGKSQADDTVYDYEEEYDGEEDDGEERNYQSQTVHLTTGNQYDIHVKQDTNTAQVGDMLQPGQSVSGYTIPPGFRGKVTSVAGSETIAQGDGKSQSQSVSLVPIEPNIIHGNKSPISETRSLKTNRERLVKDHLLSHEIQKHNHLQIQNRQSTGENSKLTTNIPMKPSYYTVTNSVAGKMDGSSNSARKYEHRYYTKSSTCGYFTFSCNIVYGSNGRTKICKPKMPTYPDGTPMKC